MPKTLAAPKVEQEPIIDKEVQYVGSSLLLSPVIACAMTVPMYMLTHNAILTILAGTCTGMAIYVGACLAHDRAMQAD